MSRWNFRNLDEIKDFDKQVNEAAESHLFGIRGLNLEWAWEIYGERDPEIFISIIDIKLNIFNMLCCAKEIDQLWNRQDVETTLFFQRLWFEFVCLYRSFYDKYMALMIKCGWPDQLRKLESAKSRTRTFLKIVSEAETAFVADGVFFHIPREFSEKCHKHIQYVNDQYRTPEVHGAGKARKWILSKSKIDEKKEREKFRNLVNDVMQYLHFIAVVSGGRKYCASIDQSNKELSTKK